MSGPDLLVIGGGFAGAVAAAAARAGGASVALVRKAWGATALSSGAIDWIAPDPAALRVLGDPASAQDHAVARLLLERPDHPIALLSRCDRQRARVQAERALEAAAGLLADGPAALAGPLGLFPSAAGEVRFADRVQASMAAGELTRGEPGRIGVLSFPELEGWRPREVAEAILEARDAERAAGVAEVVAVPARLSGSPATVRMSDAARRFEAGEPPCVDLPAGPFRCLLFPPALGHAGTPSLLAGLRQRLGHPCAEVLATSPSVPGYRLQAALEAALIARGVELVGGAAAPVGDGLAIRAGDRVLEPRAVLLATGKFLGGGIERRGKLRETVYGLPVFVADGGTGLTAERWRDPQPLLEAGLATDAVLRPREARPGVFAAGALLSGWSYPERGCGLAVCALAALRAAEGVLHLLGPRVETAR